RHGQARLLTLELFELELQLPDLLVKLFRGAAKMHPPQPRDLQLQLLARLPAAQSPAHQQRHDVLEGLPIDRAVDADAGPARQLDLNASRGAAAAECPVVAPEDGRWVTQSASSPSPAASRPLLLRPSPRSNPCRYSCRQANTWFAFTGGGVRPSLPRHRARASPRRAAASARG